MKLIDKMTRELAIASGLVLLALGVGSAVASPKKGRADIVDTAVAAGTSTRWPRP